MTPPRLFLVTAWVAYEESNVAAILLDEAEIRAVIETEARARAAAKEAKRPRGGGRTVAAWAWDGSRYVKDDAWPGPG